MEKRGCPPCEHPLRAYCEFRESAQSSEPLLLDWGGRARASSGHVGEAWRSRGVLEHRRRGRYAEVTITRAADRRRYRRAPIVEFCRGTVAVRGTGNRNGTG